MLNLFAEPRLEKFRERVLKMDPSRLNTGWEDILIPQGAMIAGRTIQDSELLAWAEGWMRLHANAGFEDGSDNPTPDPKGMGIRLCDYCGNWAFPLVAGPFVKRAKDEAMTAVIFRICDHIMKNSTRIQDEVISHGWWEYGRSTVWVDTLYYTASVLAEGYEATGKFAYAEEAIRQCILHSKFLRDETTGAFFHDANPATGLRTNWFWARGNGWVIMALADTLRRCPSSMPRWQEVLSIYRSLCTALLRWQHPCGLWRIVPEVKESHLESSGSTMIAIGLTIGVGQGWIDPTVATQIRKTLGELLTWIDPRSGALKGAQRPAGMGGWETHRLSDMGECNYATGVFLRLLGETKQYQLV